MKTVRPAHFLSLWSNFAFSLPKNPLDRFAFLSALADEFAAGLAGVGVELDVAAIDPTPGLVIGETSRDGLRLRSGGAGPTSSGSDDNKILQEENSPAASAG